MVPTRAEFEHSVDEQLGPGVVHWSDTAYMEILAHEAFHAYALSIAGHPASFGASLDESQATELLGKLPDAEVRLAAEGAALRRALDAGSIAEARAAASRFLSLRAERRAATAAPNLAAFEQEIEWSEGVARYADLRLILLAGGSGYRPIAGIRYIPANAYRKQFLARLKSPAKRSDGFRGRWEDIGAAEALVLDRLMPGWHKDVLVLGNSLEHELAGAVL